MDKKLNRHLTIGLVAILAAAGGFWYSLNNQVEQSNLPATVDFALPNISGEQKRISDWDGKLRLVNFWATWCAPCREEIPLFNLVQSRYGKEGLQVIGIAVDDLERVRVFSDDIGLDYPSLVADKQGLQLMQQFNAPGLPFSFWLDRKGRVVGTKTGAFSQPELIEELQKLL